MSNMLSRDELVEFRPDLFHRIYVFPLFLPSLRERSEDFPDLATHFARQVAAQNGWKEKLFAADAIAALRKYSWPGNVRELRNVVERLVLLAGGRYDQRRRSADGAAWRRRCEFQRQCGKLGRELFLSAPKPSSAKSCSAKSAAIIFT